VTGEGAADPMAPDRETMRSLGYRAVDHLVERWAGLEDERPWAGASRSETTARLDGPPPTGGSPPEEVMERAVREIFPLAARIDHPRFFAFVPSAPAWPSVLADILVSGHNVFQGTWLASAGPSQVELTVLEWFRRWLEMPEGASGILTSGGSAANLLALAVAREAAGWPDEPVIYLSDQGHSSLARGARVAGFRPRQIRTLPTDEGYRLSTRTVARALDEDRAAGRTPLVVCANGGATNTGAVDPLPELAALCRERGVRLHVDAAYGGFAVLDPDGARALRGLGEADSVTLDPHKWLFQTYECGCLMVREPRELEAAFRVSVEYLQDTATADGEVNFGDRGIQLTRAFRALKIWLSVQALGTDAIAEAVGRGVTLAAEAEARIRASTELELLHPAHLGVVCYRYRPEGGWSEPELETLNEEIQARVVRGGHAMISSTRLRGRYALRLCILSHRSRRHHVEETLARVEEEGRRVVGREQPAP
jgi:aromatic-L-amino-acid/L-tryptophan decarboxylase